MAESRDKKRKIGESSATYITGEQTEQHSDRVIIDGVVVQVGENTDEFMARYGIFDKLLAQVENGPHDIDPHNIDWEAELDELRDHSSRQHEEGSQGTPETVS